MKHPLRENLEIIDAGGADTISCSRCRFHYCRADQDWRQFCKTRLLPPGHAGTLMCLLDGDYLLRQFYCPSCAALLDTDFVEEKPKAAARK
jgi:acetone carboxylase gamma subunit